MLKKKSGDVEWLEFPSLQQFRLQHAVFLRKGGVSRGPYASLNTGFEVGDDARDVEENQRRIRKALGVEGLYVTKQTHGKEFSVVEEDGERNYVGDALLTGEVGKALAIGHADCQAAIIYDPYHHKVAAIHAG